MYFKFNILFLVLANLFVSCNNSDENNTQGPEAPQKEIRITKALFTDPIKTRNNQSDTQVMDQLIDLVKNTQEDEKIHLNIYLLDHQPLLNEIRKAYNRGVEIHAVVDNSRESASVKTNKNTFQFLEGILEAPSEIIKVTSDATGNSINHHKTALFSKVELPNGIAKNVVFTTSHNFTITGTQKIQDAIFTTNEGLYKVFLEDWEIIKSLAETGMKNYTYNQKNIGDSIHTYFFPRRQNGTWDGEDNYLDILDGVKDYSEAEVRVVMSDWSRTEISDKLVEIQKEGYKVKVITKNKDDNLVALERLKPLSEHGGEVNIVDMNNGNTHSKFVLVKGKKDGKESTFVYAGTHNFTYNALKNNNEVIIELINSSLFQDYWNYFEELESGMIF